MPRLLTLARTATLAALLSSAPAVAEAASVSVPNKCYVSIPQTEMVAPTEEGDAVTPAAAPVLTMAPSLGEPIPVEAEELTPGREVRIHLEVKGVMTSSSQSLTVSRRGTLDGTLDHWTTGMGYGPTKSTEARIVISDFVMGTELASTAIRVANVGWSIDPGLFDYRVKRRWFISGLSQLEGGNTYWAHYFDLKGKYLAKQMLGTTSDSCGFLRARKRLSPMSKFGKYEFRIQASSTWRGNDLPWVGSTFESVRM